MRNCDEFQVKKRDVTSILNWSGDQGGDQAARVEIPFRPARVILQDFT